MLKWKDMTSYSRSDTVRVPRVWEADLGVCRIVVHRLHGVSDVWFLSCRELRIDSVALGSITVEQAQHEGLVYVRETVHRLSVALEGA